MPLMSEPCACVLFVCACVCVSMCVYVYTCVCVYTRVCVSVRMCVCVLHLLLLLWVFYCVLFGVSVFVLRVFVCIYVRVCVGGNNIDFVCMSVELRPVKKCCLLEIRCFCMQLLLV